MFGPLNPLVPAIGILIAGSPCLAVQSTHAASTGQHSSSCSDRFPSPCWNNQNRAPTTTQTSIIWWLTTRKSSKNGPNSTTERRQTYLASNVNPVQELEANCSLVWNHELAIRSPLEVTAQALEVPVRTSNEVARSISGKAFQGLHPKHSWRWLTPVDTSPRDSLTYGRLLNGVNGCNKKELCDGWHTARNGTALSPARIHGYGRVAFWGLAPPIMACQCQVVYIILLLS